jgi:hypothetical protein
VVRFAVPFMLSIRYHGAAVTFNLSGKWQLDQVRWLSVRLEAGGQGDALPVRKEVLLDGKQIMSSRSLCESRQAWSTAVMRDWACSRGRQSAAIVEVRAVARIYSFPAIRKHAWEAGRRNKPRVKPALPARRGPRPVFWRPRSG